MTLAVTIATRSTFSRRTRPGPRSNRGRATSPRRTVRPDGVGTGSASSSSRDARSRSGRRTTTRETTPSSTISPASVPWNSASTERERLAGVRPWSGRARRSKSMTSCGTLACSVFETSTSPGTRGEQRLRPPRQAPQHREVGAEDLDRQVGLAARDHVVDAVADRLPEGDLGAGDGGHGLAHLGEQLLLGPALAQHDLHLGGVDPLDVLVPLGPAGAAARRDHLGEVEQRLLDLAPQRVALLQGDARRADHRRP